MEELSIALYKTEGSSDKEYHVLLKRDGEGFRVFSKNGRRGKALRDGEKTKAPLPYDEAFKLYQKTVKSKTKTGYTEDESGAAFSSSEYAGQHTGFQPRLLNDITDEEAIELSKQKTPDGQDVWWVQQKHDGERRGIEARDDRLVFSNKRGLEVGVNQKIADDIEKLRSAARQLKVFELDTEDMGDHVVVFDVLGFDLTGIRDLPFFARKKFLSDLHSTAMENNLTSIKVDIPIPASEFFAGYHDQTGKRFMLEKAGAEGYVMINACAPYEPGRPNSGGDAFRRKFRGSCTARVKQQNGTKRSVAIEMLDQAGSWTDVGNVTIPSDAEIPSEGSLIEVKYLYAYPGGSIYQPVFKGVRHDQTEEACMISTLKFKTEEPQFVPLGAPA